ncbi:MAG: enoyl-CoA hydratase [Dehalococcoidia bacterium]|nr:MAG: enoyl-CoA hydratase [Dehalococcoidia bacterium]
MSERFCQYTIDAQGIGVVTFHRPPVNAMTVREYEEVGRTFRELASREQLRVVILRSALPRVFLAGRDIHEFLELDPEKAAQRAPVVRECFWAVYECPVPTIAAVNGAALGAGMLLVSLCDLVIAAETAFFGLPEINVGSLGGAKHLARWVPQPMVRRLMFTGERIAAAELQRLGVIDQVVPLEQLEAAARQRAEELAAKSPVALRLAKEVLNRIEFLDLRSGYELEQSYTARLMGYEDSKEAARAFLEKRQPVFRGR